MERGGGFALLSRSLDNPVTVALWLMRVEREVRLRRVVAVMVVEVRVALNRGEVCATVAIIVRVWGSPYLALLRSPRRPFVLVAEAMRLVSPLTRPLLLLVGHPCTLIGEVAVVAPTAHVVMRVVASSLGTHLRADWRRGLIGCSRAGAGLLDGS